jgi:hypothetical protein
MSTIDIFLNYPDSGSGTAEWTIAYNGTDDIAKGTDNVDKVYGDTKQCYEKLHESLNNYGFGISENSKYNSIDGMYYDDLVKKLGGNSQKTTTTTKASAPKASVTISLSEVKGLQGISVVLNVSGSYSSYYYTCYEYGAGSSSPYTKSGNSSSSSIEVSAFSGGVNKVVVEVTPYNSDGVPGDTVSSTFVPSFASGGNNKTVTSCKKYGTINSPSGSKVDGLTRSYLIDGGGASYERHDLTHGWHITAVNEYFDGSTYWYELYDSDDGDYYGWVASYNISFY